MMLGNKHKKQHGEIIKNSCCHPINRRRHLHRHHKREWKVIAGIIRILMTTIEWKPLYDTNYTQKDDDDDDHDDDDDSPKTAATTVITRHFQTLQ